MKRTSRILLESRDAFHVSSGLKVNFKKSKVFGIGVDSQEVLSMATPLGCMPTTLHFTYLGVPVGANIKLKKHWKLVVEKFQLRLNTWKSKKLSLGGRLTLTKVVLGSLPTLYSSLFVASTGILKTLEKYKEAVSLG